MIRPIALLLFPLAIPVWGTTGTSTGTLYVSLFSSVAVAFTTRSTDGLVRRRRSSVCRYALGRDTRKHLNPDDDHDVVDSNSNNSPDRRDILGSLLGAGGCVLLYGPSGSPMAHAAGTDTSPPTTESTESFASLAERANKMSKEVDAVRPRRSSDSMIRPTNQTIYDFSLPVNGVAVPMEQLIRQEFSTQRVTSSIFSDKDDNNKNAQLSYREAKVKAILVVNIKQDDPVARKTIPELISLAAKYGRGSDYELAIVACPTDQGYYEPDTSQLLKLKLASEYGYGINPSTVVTDKVNLLGTGAVPVWRWLQTTSRTPAGLGRVEGNFEKFLINGRTGLPVRRYPRKYRALNMADDIEAVIAGRPLPPAQAGYLEEWRTAAADAERDTYRFEKGLNVFDQ